MNRRNDYPPRETAASRRIAIGRMMTFLRFHREGMGLLIGAAIMLALGGLALAIATQETVAYGTIMEFGVGAFRSASTANARVWVDGREAVVGVSQAYGCAVGDRVELRRRRVFVGNTYSLGPRACSRAE